MNKNTLERIAIWAFLIVILGGTIFVMAKLGAGSATPGSAAPLADAVTEADWFKGNKDAKVTLLEYSDFQCPACAAYYPVLKQLVTELGNDIKIVYRHFPLSSIHANAQAGAWATEAAGNQGRFWEMHDKLFENQNVWASTKDPFDTFKRYAEELKLDINKFKADYESNAVHDKVDEQYKSGVRSGVNSTPSFFLNGQRMQNARDYNYLKSKVQAEIDKNK
jgi:protein-disulfide isomerase